MYKKLFGHYKIIRPEIGYGGSSVVHEAIDENGKRVAIKVVNYPADKKDLQNLFFFRFKNEYQNLTKLFHKNIAKVFKIDVYNNSFFIVSEFVNGASLDEYLRGKTPKEMLPIFIEALGALDYIHRNGLIHLDIKPENILIAKTPKGPVLKIIDFGLTIATSEYAGELVGSLPYIAPEVALGHANEVDLRADLFSFGVVMYKCLTWGRFPFPRSGIKKARDELRYVIASEEKFKIRPPSYAHHRSEEFPAFLDTIVMRLIAHNPAERFYGNARAVINALATQQANSFACTDRNKENYLHPIGNKHIGRRKIQKEIIRAIDAFARGKSLKYSIYNIHGQQGLGKTHLLNNLNVYAHRYIDRINIELADGNKQPILLPKDAKPTLLMIDNVTDSLIHSQFVNVLSLADSGTLPLVVVFASETSLIKNNSARSFGLKAFSEKEIMQYFKSTPALCKYKIPTSFVRKLKKITKGIPLELIEHLAAWNKQGLLFDIEGNVFASFDDKSLRFNASPNSTRTRISKLLVNLTEEEKSILEYISAWCLHGFSNSMEFDSLRNFYSGHLLRLHLNHLIELGIIKLDSGYSFTDPNFAKTVHNTSKNIEKVHDSIAGYISNTRPDSSNLILLHKSFGSDSKSASIATLKLAKKMLHDLGNCEISANLLERLSGSHKLAPKLLAYTKGLLAESLFYGGNSETAVIQCKIAEKIINKSNAVACKWGLLTYLGIIKITAFTHQLKFKAASNCITELQKMIPQHCAVFHIILSNMNARILYTRVFQNASGSGRVLLEQSEKIYKQNLEKLGNNANHLVNNNELGTIFYLTGQYEEAQKNLEQQLFANRHNVFSRFSILYRLAETARLAKNYSCAIDFGKQALNLAQKTDASYRLVHAHSILANIYHDMDRFNDAIEENKKCLLASAYLQDTQSDKTTKTKIWLNMGHCYKEKGEYDKALTYFEMLIGDKNADTVLMSAYHGMGEVYFKKGNFTKALTSLDKAENFLNKMPPDPLFNIYKTRLEKIRTEIDNFRDVL